VGEIDHRVVAAELVGHVVVGGPVVLPALVVEVVAEAIGLAGFEVDGQREPAVAVSSHGVRLLRPGVEVATDVGALCPDGGVDLEGHRHVTVLGTRSLDHGRHPTHHPLSA
jgi:hypothetical protein